MKREILCFECGQWPQVQPSYGSYDKIKMEQGSALKKYLCDHCNAMIDKGAQCFAVSQWFTGRGLPYVPWEHDYIDMGGDE